MKQAKKELLQKLNLLERKNKFNKAWDTKVKQAFVVTGSMSFEELIFNDSYIANQLIIEGKNI